MTSLLRLRVQPDDPQRDLVAHVRVSVCVSAGPSKIELFRSLISSTPASPACRVRTQHRPREIEPGRDARAAAERRPRRVLERGATARPRTAPAAAGSSAAAARARSSACPAAPPRRPCPRRTRARTSCARRAARRSVRPISARDRGPMLPEMSITTTLLFAVEKNVRREPLASRDTSDRDEQAARSARRRARAGRPIVRCACRRSDGASVSGIACGSRRSTSGSLIGRPRSAARPRRRARSTPSAGGRPGDHASRRASRARPPSPVAGELDRELLERAPLVVAAVRRGRPHARERLLERRQRPRAPASATRAAARRALRGSAGKSRATASSRSAIEPVSAAAASTFGRTR